MATHDYVIGNQTAPSFRTDLNNALSAIVSQNSGTTAPSTTYANMIWYDTTNDILKMRNESNTAWISLFSLDQTTDTAFAVDYDIADQSTAEAGSDNTQVMTPLRVSQAIDALSPQILSTVVSTGKTHSTVYQNSLTPSRPLGVMFAAGGANRAIQISSNASMSGAFSIGNTGDYISTHYFIVPAGWYWRINGAPIALNTIYEVR